jgi:hypothetical protein
MESNEIQTDLFADQYTELEKLSADFHLLQKYHLFEYEFEEMPNDRERLTITKENTSIKISSSRGREFLFSKAIEQIPLNFKT